MVSLDGFVDGFEPNIGTYYAIASSYRPDASLVGSTTAKTGITELPPEEESDFKKPRIKSSDKRPFWVIPDSRGILKNLLHVYRRMEYCKDVILLVSKSSPQSYLDYLKERHYDIITTGEDYTDYREALEILYNRYKTRVVITDSGGTLNSILLEEGLVDEISLLISPVLVGNKNTNLFRSLKLTTQKKKIDLELLKNEIIDKNHVLLVYKVLK